MDGKYKTLAKDTVIFAIGSLGSKLILFFLVPLYTNFLTREEYGISELVTTFVQLLVPFAAASINLALIRFGMKKDRRGADVLKVSCVVLLLSLLVTFIFIPFLYLYKPIGPWKWYLIALIILTNFSEVFKNYLKVLNQQIFCGYQHLKYAGVSAYKHPAFDYVQSGNSRISSRKYIRTGFYYSSFFLYSKDSPGT